MFSSADEDFLSSDYRSFTSLLRSELDYTPHKMPDMSYLQAPHRFTELASWPIATAALFPSSSKPWCQEPH